MGSRRRARELALQMLFENDMTGAPPEEMFGHSEELHHSAESTRAYAKRLVCGTLDHRPEIDALIVGQADNWRLERMPAVDRNILRLALYEMRHEPDTPAPVVIDEALEIAKRFSTPKSSQFINGILDGVLKSPASEAKKR
jgi:transcription antitermination protein NusB